MAISKIILNGVTQMDLTSDTVQASNLIAPNTAHGADGEAIVGTASSGVDVPIFTIVRDPNTGDATSITCNKTFAQCLEYGNSGYGWGLCHEVAGDEEYYGTIDWYEQDSSHVIFTAMDGIVPMYDIQYNSSGSITITEPSAQSETMNITENGDYYPTGYTSLVHVAVPSSGSSVKTATGTFTGNGTRQVEISCNFEPDLIYWTSNPGTTASSGTVAGIIAREMMSANRYRNNSTSNSHYAVIDITDMNTGGSSYSFRATYANNTVTLYCFSNNARSLFTNGRTYTYQFVKWTT